MLKPGLPTPGWPSFLRPHIALQTGTGILTCFPSTTLFSLALGADSPCADERCAGNLGLSASGPFTRFIATHVSIRTSDTSSRGYPPPSQAYGTLLYHPKQSLDCATSTKHKVDALMSQRDSKASNRPLRRAGPSHTQLSLRSARLSHINEWLRRGARSSFDGGSIERNQVDCLRSAASVIGLSPVTSSAQDDSISELLRFL